MTSLEEVSKIGRTTTDGSTFAGIKSQSAAGRSLAIAGLAETDDAEASPKQIVEKQNLLVDFVPMDQM